MAMPSASLPLLLAASEGKPSKLFTLLFTSDAGRAEAWFTIGLVGVVFALLTFTTLTPDIIMLGAVVVLMLLGILSPDQALSGMSDPGVLSIGALFVVAAGMQETGGINWVAMHLFGRPKTVLSGIARLVFPTISLSAFIANTPLVVMLLPAVDELSRRQ